MGAEKWERTDSSSTLQIQIDGDESMQSTIISTVTKL